MPLPADLRDLPSDPAVTNAGPSGNSFSRGLRSGMTSAGGSLQALAGGLGEAAGYTDFAKERYAAAAAAQARAAQQAPEVNDYHQVLDAPDIGTGLRRAGSYVAGMAGQALPSLALAGGAGMLTAATGGGALAAGLAGTAALAPLETGGALQRQQADPTALTNNTAGERLLSAGAEGLGRSALMTAPGIGSAAGLFGKAARAGSLGAAVGKAALTDVGGNAAGMAGAEALSQRMATGLNPDRDTSGDNAALAQSGVEGGLFGLPFVGAHAIGHVAGAPGAAVRAGASKLGDAVGAARDKVAAKLLPGDTSAPAAKPSDALTDHFAAKNADKLDPEITSLAQGVDVAAENSTHPEEYLKKQSALMSKLDGIGQSLLADDRVDPTVRAQVSDAYDKYKAGGADKDFAEAVAKAKTSDVLGRQVGGAVDRMTAAVGAAYEKYKPAAGTKLSEDNAGVRRALSDTIMPWIMENKPEIMNRPESVASLGSTLQKLMALTADGKADPQAMSHFQNFFGKDASAIFLAMHDNIDPESKARLGTVKSLQDDAIKTQDASRAVEKIIPDDVAGAGEGMDMHDYKAIASAVQNHVDESAYAGMGGAERSVRSTKFMSDLADRVGGPEVATKLVKEFTKRNEASKTKASDMESQGSHAEDKLSADEQRQEDAQRGEARTEPTGKESSGYQEFNPADAQDATVQYGKGDAKAPDLVGSPELDSKLYGKPKEQTVAGQLTAQNSGKHGYTSFVSAKELGADHPAVMRMKEKLAGDLVRDKAAHEKTQDAAVAARTDTVYKQLVDKAEKSVNSGKALSEVKQAALRTEAEGIAKGMAPREPFKPGEHHDIGNYGLVEGTGTKDDTHMTTEQFAGVQAKTKSELTGPSRIDTKGGAVDAIKVVRLGYKLLGNKDLGPDDGLHKVYRAFVTGMGAVADHTGTADIMKTGASGKGMLKGINPDTVVVRRKGEGNNITVRDLMDAKYTTEPDTKAELNAKDVEKMPSHEVVALTADGVGNMHADDLRTIRDDLAERTAKMRADVYENTELHKTRGAVKRSMALLRENSEYQAMREATAEVRGELSTRYEDAANARAEIVGGSDRANKAGGAQAGLDIDSNNNVHAVAAVRGEKNMQINHNDPVRDSRAPTADPVADGKKFNDKLEKIASIGAPQKAVVDRIRALDAVANTKDVQRLRGETILSTKVRDLSDTVTRLESKYAKELAAGPKPPTDAEPSIWGAAAKKGDATSEAALAGGKLAATVDGKIVLDRAAIEADHAAGMPSLLKDAHVAGAMGWDKDTLASTFRTPEDLAQYKLEQERATFLHPDDPVLAAQTALDSQRYSTMRAGGARVPDDVQRTVIDHIEKVLGPKMKVEFLRSFHNGTFSPREGIKISVHSLDPMGTAFHESLHAFISKLGTQGLADVGRVLTRAAGDEHVMGQLRELLKNEPDALRQIEQHPEEAAAYMYQFAHSMDANGKPLLTVTNPVRSALGKVKDYIGRVLGMWTNDDRAIHIMNEFQSGRLADVLNDRNALSRVLVERGTNQTFDAIKKSLAPLARLAENVAGAGDAVLRGKNNKALTDIANLVISRTTDKATDPGFIPAQGSEYRRRMNGLMDKISGTNAQPEHIADALQALQSQSIAKTAEGRLVVRAVDDMLSHGENGLFKYMTDAGVNTEGKSLGKNYFPVVWSPSTVAANAKAFVTMLQKYEARGDITAGASESIMRTLINNGGSDLGVNSIETMTPGMQFLKKRTLDFIDPADRAPFLNKDLLGTIASYTQQATRRAEWARRMGDDGGELGRLITEAQTEHGASASDIADVQKYIRGIDGTLGDDIDPGTRRLFGNMLVYQNIRLLPMAVFSMAVDPMGIVVRGGTVKDAFHAFKRGLSEIPSGFKRGAERDDWYRISQTMGAIEDENLIHALGSSYSQGMVGDTGRSLNDKFFKYNMVEQMNTSMRVAAVKAAVGFIGRHGDGTYSTHSRRWLAELGLKPKEIVMGSDGRPLLTKQEFMDAGFGKDEAQIKADKMQVAVNKWTDGAVLRPNAAQKPVWMNDPHFALIAHLKQFAYSFNETIIKRTINEAKHGNYTPAVALASYVPIMIAADALKGAIVTGGGTPSYKQDWGVGDYVSNGMERAGLYGAGQFGIDAVKDAQRGGSGLSLLGPTVEQLGDVVKTIGGRESLGSFVMHAMPANALVSAAAGNSAVADPVASE
jgi:hypothetical protein